MNSVAYPTVEHRNASEAIVSFFAAGPNVEAVILTGSCARGKATRDSCLDVALLVPPQVLSTEKAALEHSWNEFYETEPVFDALRHVGKYSHIDLNFVDGCFVLQPHGWTSGADGFELEIGNTLVYSVALWECGDRLVRLREHWLPYYDEELRRERLGMVRRYCRNNLDHIPLYVERGLYFQAFQRLHHAFQEFLQALFISRRIYPIAYDKWICEQVVEILGMPQLYAKLPRLFEIQHFESREIAGKAATLGDLLDEYTKGGNKDDQQADTRNDSSARSG